MLASLLLAGLGIAFSPWQDLAAVEQNVAELVRSQPSAGNWQKLGLSRYLQNKYGPAIEAFHQALGRDSSLWTSHLFLGISMYRTNQFSPALAALENADRLAPAMAQGRDDVDYWLGATLIALRRPLQGLQPLERLIARNPRHSEALRLATETYAETASSLWNGVAERAFETAAGQEVHGYALESAGNRTGALEAFRRSRRQAPQRPGPGAAIGRLLLSSGDVGAAQDALTKELQTDPVSPEANLYAGLLALRENRPGEAEKFLKVAAAWLPENEEPPLALCQAYLALGNPIKAVAAARQAITAESGSPAAHELLLTALAAAGDRPAVDVENHRWQQQMRAR
ncbi:MAG TPA: tetratricopeptide repeat protein [Bryobacteraceae bacterium]|nr:tetratricopeptide repeat protein [Bryobacteraceae bacterium]